MDLSIIIVNWNTRKLLAECLKSLKQNICTCLRHETIVVDNGSSDGSIDMIRKEFPSVLLIANKTNLGYVRANNQGSSVAIGRYILLLNSDTVLLEGGVEDIVGYLDSHSDVGIATGIVLNPDRTFHRPFRRW